MKLRCISRGLALLSAALMILPAAGQEKIFQEALNNGRSPGKFYEAWNKKGKNISLEKVKKYCAEQNYILGDYNTRTIDKFGDKGEALNVVKFLPYREYTNYMYENILSPNTVPTFSSLTSKGSAYIFSERWNGGNFFRRFNNIMWSGTVVNGMLEGEGVGFAQYTDAEVNSYNSNVSGNSIRISEYWTNSSTSRTADQTSTSYIPAVSTTNGSSVKMREVYQETTYRTGEKLYQEITGLKNGTYRVEIWATACYTPNRGFSSKLTKSNPGTEVVCVKANDAKKYIQTEVTSSTRAKLYTLYARVTDGTLRLSMVAEKEGANWFAIQTKSVTMEDLSNPSTTALPAIESYAGNGYIDYHNGKEQRFMLVKGTFKAGIPQDEVKVYFYQGVKEYFDSYCSVEKTFVGTISGGMASFKHNGKYGFISTDGVLKIYPTYPRVLKGFQNGRAEVKTDSADIVINARGQFVDYTAAQKKIYADERARQARILAAEKARQDSIARAKRLAEEKAAEEKRLAEEKEADLKRRIEENKNPRLWAKGCRLAYRYDNGYEYVLATLEEWNENRSMVKVKIVASPSSTRTLNGEVLEKNNTMWVSAKDEGWHLALKEEIDAALKNDNSQKRVTQSSSSSSGPRYSSCSDCHGTGFVQCYGCYGKGREKVDTWDESKGYQACHMCAGTGRVSCSSCDGTGRR